MGFWYTRVKVYCLSRRRSSDDQTFLEMAHLKIEGSVRKVILMCDEFEGGEVIVTVEVEDARSLQLELAHENRAKVSLIQKSLV